MLNFCKGKPEPEPEPEPDDLATAVRKLMNRSYDTYKARIAARDRLDARYQAWNASMIALTSAVAVAGLGLLKDPNMYGGKGDLLIAALSVLALVASLVVANANYGARSQNMERSYKQIQALSVRAEAFHVNPATATAEQYERLRSDYSQLLEASENQSAGDHAYAQAQRRKPSGWLPAALHPRCWKESAITAAPYVSLLLPVILLQPFLDAITGAM